MNHYITLGVARNATHQEIKTAYKALALKYHPDKNKSPEAEAKFKEIGTAYEILGDEYRKRCYDIELQHSAPYHAPVFSTYQPSQSTIKEATFINILTTTNIPPETRLKYVFEVACLNSKLFEKHRKRIILALPHKELFFLVQTGPTISINTESHAPILVKLAFCNPNFGKFADSIKNGVSPLVESYRCLIQTILQTMRNSDNKLTDIEITAIFMASMIFSESEIYTYLKNMLLNYPYLLELHDELNILLHEKQMVVNCHGQPLSAQDILNLECHFRCHYKKLSDILSQLQLEATYNCSLNKVVDLLECYKQEHVQPFSFFTKEFLNAELSNFSREDQHSFIRNLIIALDLEQDSTHEKLHELLSFLANFYSEDIVDAIFHQIKEDVMNATLEPSILYQRANDARLSNAKQALHANQHMTIIDKIQFIYRLADDSHSSHFKLSMFKTHQSEDHYVIKLCKKWSNEFELIFEDITRPRVHNTNLKLIDNSESVIISTTLANVYEKSSKLQDEDTEMTTDDDNSVISLCSK